MPSGSFGSKRERMAAARQFKFKLISGKRKRQKEQKALKNKHSD